MEVGPLGLHASSSPTGTQAGGPPSAGCFAGWLEPGKGQRGRFPRSGAVAVITGILATEQPAGSAGKVRPTEGE